MAETLFNIFGAHPQGPIQNKLLPTNQGENALAAKKLGAIQKGLTPSKLNKNIHSPKIHSIKKKTFLQNEGASIQAFRSLSGSQKTTSTPALKKKLQIYEDSQPVNSIDDEIIKMEYNRKPVVETSDDEFEFTNEQVDKLIFGLPTNNYVSVPKIETPKMLISPSKGEDDFDDLFNDAESDFEDDKYESDASF